MKRDLTTKLNKQDLFEAGIVETILQCGPDDPEPIDKLLNYKGKVYNYSFPDGMDMYTLYSRKPIDYDLTEYNLGISLGYPPDCVDLWSKYFNLISSGVSNSLHEFGLNYNGIKFNIMRQFSYSIKWCVQQYDDSIIKLFGTSEFVLYSNSHDFTVRRIKDRNTEFITINGDEFNKPLSQLLYFLNKYLR